MSRGSQQRSSSRAEHAPAPQLDLFDVVRVRQAPEGSGLAPGDEGTIVEIAGGRAFLVDFSGASAADPHGDDPVHELSADQLALVRKFRAR